MKFIELTYEDDSTVFVRLKDIQLITPIQGGSSVVFLSGDSANFKEDPRKIFVKEVYTFNE